MSEMTATYKMVMAVATYVKLNRALAEIRPNAMRSSNLLLESVKSPKIMLSQSSLVSLLSILITMSC